MRSDWVPVGNAAAIDAAGDKLNHYSSLLAKVHGWLELANSPADASTDEFYTLALFAFERYFAASGQSNRTPGRSAEDGPAFR